VWRSRGTAIAWWGRQYMQADGNVPLNGALRIRLLPATVADAVEANAATARATRISSLVESLVVDPPAWRTAPNRCTPCAAARRCKCRNDARRHADRAMPAPGVFTCGVDRGDGGVAGPIWRYTVGAAAPAAGGVANESSALVDELELVNPPRFP
jgi:hypothetical protein